VDLVLGEESMKGGYKWMPLREDSYYGVVPRDHELADRRRISVEELVQYPFIMSQILELKQKLRPLIKTPIQ
jgi:DNA-binding transcriptional LysR family regulator